MKTSLALYEKAIPKGKSFEEMFEITRTCGFDRLELSVDETDERLARLDWSVQKQRDLARLALESCTPITTMCLSGHRKYPFGSHDSATRQRSIDIMHKAIDFAYQTNIRIIQLAGYDVYYEDQDESTLENFQKGLEDGVKYASSAGILLGFETMETPFMDTVKKSMHYVNLLNSPYLGVYPDIGNLKNAAVLYNHDVVEDLKCGKGHLVAVHLKETKPGLYRDMNFGDPTGHTEYVRCLKEVLTQGVGMFTGEFWYQEGQDYIETITHASAFLKDKIAQALKEIESC